MYFKDLPVNSFTEAIDLMTAGGKRLLGSSLLLLRRVNSLARGEVGEFLLKH